MIPLEAIAPGRAASPVSEEVGNEVQVLEFVLDSEQFAIDLFDVREVVEYTPITPLPGQDPSILGIIDLRGEITTIIDLSRMLSLDDRDRVPLDERRIIVLDESILSYRVGILVDEVRAVSTFEQGQIDRTMTRTGQSEAYILGVIKRPVLHDRGRTELLIWIDVRQLVRGW